jgi:hypothetical protein
MELVLHVCYFSCQMEVLIRCSTARECIFTCRLVVFLVAEVFLGEVGSRK